MPAPNPRLRPVRVTVPSRELDCDVSRIVGYRQTSKCGKFTAKSRRVQEVRAAMREHVTSCADCSRVKA